MKEKIIKVIFSSIDEVNQHINSNQKIAKDLDTVLMGENSSLDSLDLINIITTVEENIEDYFNTNITLADEASISRDKAPFESVRALAEYIEELLERKKDDA